MLAKADSQHKMFAKADIAADNGARHDGKRQILWGFGQ